MQDIASQLHAAGVERVFVTRGSRGVFYSTGDKQGIFKLSRKNRIIRNAGGAGDAFLAGLAAVLTLSDTATSSPALSLTAINQALEARDVS